MNPPTRPRPSECPREPASTTGGMTQQDHIQPLLVSRIDAAKMLGVSDRKLAQLVACRAIPSVKVGTRRLFEPEQLREWVRRGCPTTPGGDR